MKLFKIFNLRRPNAVRLHLIGGEAWGITIGGTDPANMLERLEVAQAERAACRRRSTAA